MLLQYGNLRTIKNSFHSGESPSTSVKYSLSFYDNSYLEFDWLKTAVDYYLKKHEIYEIMSSMKLLLMQCTCRN